MIVGLLRHGRTAWNDAGRLQGRADLPLSAAGREQVQRWHLPAELGDARVVSSPLQRAIDTARLATGRGPAIEPDLIEMHWGVWEGETFASLREHHRDAFAAAEARGLDFRPPGGESLRDVQHRLFAWLVRVAGDAGPVVAVTHKGVLNVLVAHLTGWSGIGRSPVKLKPDCAHLVDVDRDGRVRVRAWNVGLVTERPVEPGR